MEQNSTKSNSERNRKRIAVLLLIVAFLLLGIVSLYIDSELRKIQFNLTESQFFDMLSKFHDAVGHIEIDLSNLAIALGPRNDSLTNEGIDVLRDRAKDNFYHSAIELYLSIFRKLPSDSMLASWRAMDYSSLAEKDFLPLERYDNTKKGVGLHAVKTTGDIPLYRELAGRKSRCFSSIRSWFIVFAFLFQGVGMYLLNVPYIRHRKEQKEQQEESLPKNG